MSKIRMSKINFFTLSIALGLGSVSTVNAQTVTKAASMFDGTVVAGYVDDGAYINFTGPHIKWVKKPYALLLGVLPSLRIKEDKVAAGAKKNSIVTPSLGAGITFAYKHLALQVPLYYNAKTGTADGKWNVGFGIGYKF
jgi:hypothetical protein